MQCRDCLSILGSIGEAFSTPHDTSEPLGRAARAMVEKLQLKACHFLLLSRDRTRLEHAASHGLSDSFLSLDPGPVEQHRALAKRTLAIADCSTDPRVRDSAAHATEGLASALVVPLMTQDQVIGEMRLYSGEPRRFSDVELELSGVAAALCTRAIQQSMFQRVQDELHAAALSSLDPDRILESSARVIAQGLWATGCSIHLVEGQRLRVRAAHGLSSRLVEVWAAARPEELRLALAGSCSQLYDAGEKPRSPFIDEVIREGIASILYVPLVSRHEVIGVLCLYTQSPHRFSADELFFLRGIADHCALGVLQARMHSDVKQAYESLVDEFQLWFEASPRSACGGT